MKAFASYLRFVAEGAQLSAFRDALRKENIPCMRQVIMGGRFHGMIHPHYRKPFFRLAEACDIRITLTEEKGWRVRLRPLRLRYGLLAGLLPAAAFLWWSNSTIRSIEIYGNQTISDTHLLRVMEELGICRGAAYADLDLSLAEQQLRLAVSDLEWITLRHTGGRLVVELEEETKPPQRYADRIPTNYVATVTAQITEMQVYNGKALVSVGDAVKAGDVLISGVTEDVRGISYLKHADGIITGIYEETLHLYHPFCKETTVTGAVSNATYLECFGKRFSLSPGFTAPQKDFIYTETVTPLKLFGRELPFYKIDCRYSRQETTIAVYSPQEIAAMQEEEALRFEQNFHSKDQILGKEYIQTVDDLGISLKIHYIFKGVIGKTSEIFVKMQ